MAIFAGFDRTEMQRARDRTPEEAEVVRDALNEALADHAPAINDLLAEAYADEELGACVLVLPVKWRPAGNPDIGLFADGLVFEGNMVMWAPVDAAYVGRIVRPEAVAPEDQ